MGNIILKGGHLWKDGEKLELEFGNQEQIKFLRDYERRAEYFKGDGLPVDPSYETRVTGRIMFECLCGSNRIISRNCGDEEDPSYFDGTKEKCNTCFKEYVLETYKTEVSVKLK